MNHDTAADVRDTLNGKDYVRGPDDDHDSAFKFRLARVHQTGYMDGQPFFEVLLTPQHGRDSVHLPRDFVRWVADAGMYLRVDADGDVHVRDHLGNDFTN